MCEEGERTEDKIICIKDDESDINEEGEEGLRIRTQGMGVREMQKTKKRREINKGKR